MQDDEKTKAQLIDELRESRLRVTELETVGTRAMGIEKALRERAQTLKSILSASPVGIVRTQDRRIRWANQAFQEMFGFGNEQEYIHQHTSIMHPSEVEYENVRSMLYANVKRGEESETDAILRLKLSASFRVLVNDCGGMGVIFGNSVATNICLLYTSPSPRD